MGGGHYRWCRDGPVMIKLPLCTLVTSLNYIYPNVSNHWIDI